MSRPREFWIKDKSNEYNDDQFWATEQMEYDTDIHVIEKSVVDKLKAQLAIHREALFSMKCKCNHPDFSIRGRVCLKCQALARIDVKPVAVTELLPGDIRIVGRFKGPVTFIEWPKEKS